MAIQVSCAHTWRRALAGGARVTSHAWDAIGDLPGHPNEPGLDIRGKWGDLLPTIPEGHNYLWHTNLGRGVPLFGWRTRYWNLLSKLAKDRPLWTVQAQPGPAIGPFHWKNRRLTAAELCRIQTFPDGLQFNSGRTDIQKMLGNAVPSLVAEVLAWEMRRQLFDDRRRSGRLRLEPSSRSVARLLSPLPKSLRNTIS
jgi:DNA (cytosine-5)-methyltransferase 1